MMRYLLSLALAAMVGLPAAAQEPDRPAPRARPPATTAIAPRQAEFETWQTAFRGRALARGVRRDVVDGVLENLRYDPTAILSDRADGVQAIWEYLDAAVSEERIAAGRQALEDRGRILDAIEARYGVDREILVAIWGIESSYGARMGGRDLIGTLATLAFDGSRPAYFESQLVAALKILESGDVTREDLAGSWSGEMGHTQLIPTSYLIHAVDFTGDGRRDVWGDSPADALASTAGFLASHGWVKDVPWGVEVTLPEGFDYAQASRKVSRLPSEWAELGVEAADGTDVPDFGEASVLSPVGASGAAFLVFSNFRVLERYDTADAHVVAVGHLADRLSGGSELSADWPRDDRDLDLGERSELQRLLTAAGFDTQGVDGKIGPLTIAAVRAWQRANGRVPDGYASLVVLESLRGS